MHLAAPRSFGRKLFLLVLLATSAGVVVQGAVVSLVSMMEMKSAALAQLSSDAAVIATHSAAALAFDDKAAGTETLAALDAAPTVSAALILDRDGALFAAYRRPGAPGALDVAPLPGHRFDGERLLLGRPIFHDGRSLGSLVMVYDLSPYYAGLRRNVLISIVIGAGAVAVALLAARRLQRALARPIAALVATSRRVSLSRDYSLRVARFKDDELGHVADSFNGMLAAIEERDADLLEVKRALEASNDQLQQFAYVASHDLQEPLRKIQTFSSLLMDGHSADLSEEALDYLNRMGSAAARMRNLITDLLTYSRISSKDPTLVDVDLNAAIRTVLSDLEVRIQESKGIVEVDRLPTVRADELHVHQLFLNLIGNALKFSRPGVPPVVRVRAEAPPHGAHPAYWKLTVEDNGIGFEDRYADRIFLPFQRLHGRGEYEGTGMGLAVCRRIADRHGWPLTVTSRPGEGTTFTMVLPGGPVAAARTDPARPPAVRGAAA